MFGKGEHALCLSVRGPFRSGAGVPGSSANWFRAAGRDRSIHGSRASAPISGRRCARAAVCKAASTRIFLAGLSFSHANIFASDSESLLIVWNKSKQTPRRLHCPLDGVILFYLV